MCIRLLLQPSSAESLSQHRVGPCPLTEVCHASHQIYVEAWRGRLWNGIVSQLHTCQWFYIIPPIRDRHLKMVHEGRKYVLSSRICNAAQCIVLRSAVTGRHAVDPLKGREGKNNFFMLWDPSSFCREQLFTVFHCASFTSRALPERIQIFPWLAVDIRKYIAKVSAIGNLAPQTVQENDEKRKKKQALRGDLPVAEFQLLLSCYSPSRRPENKRGSECVWCLVWTFFFYFLEMISWNAGAATETSWGGYMWVWATLTRVIAEAELLISWYFCNVVTDE